MRINIPGLGGRLRRARNETGLSQEAVAEQICVSWMTVLRWEHSQRAIPGELLKKLSQIYNRSIRWFLTLEEGDLDREGLQSGETPGECRLSSSEAAERLFRKIAEAPAAYRPMIEKVVDDILDELSQVA